MSRPESLATIARELAALAGADRRAILGALPHADRARILAAMRVPPRADAVPVAVAQGTHSAWFDRLKTEAADPAVGRTTAAARTALLDAIGHHAPPMPRAPGRSLLEAASGLLVGTKVR